ncbi:MAG: hypothetical protein K2Y51_06420 [Gammaproteobacteria bacterium]|jgi:hypothetical protein|nr:hypothetical protein [Gammaproteobacteria bacterium]
MKDNVEIVDFPNAGVRAVDEAERFVVWEEIFSPGVATCAHRHRRDYIAFFPDGGELTLCHVAGGFEDYAVLSGGMSPLPSSTSGARFAIAPGTAIRSRVPPEGTVHVALNEGGRPLRMVLVEFK